jgi:hypothetical protein
VALVLVVQLLVALSFMLVVVVEPMPAVVVVLVEMVAVELL